jgi:U32 family peptidase
MRKNKIEVLAPVGSFDTLQAAIQAGADAVYFGVEQLNMRAKSVNSFLVTDIKDIAATCHNQNVKCYLTLNTVMYNHDLQLASRILKEAQKQGVDAVIASDFAIIQLCNELAFPLHISTQANVSNIASINFFSRYADVIVLARELTLKQVEELTKEVERKKIKGVSGNPLKIEVFAHGALCMAISGKCYLSLHSQNAAANRGACIQSCRHPYKVTDLETNEELVVDNEYIMSSKDLCTIDILDELLNAGVDVLKIEGRGKSADYVYTTTKCYKEAVTAIQQRSYTANKINAWKKELAAVYNRGFWEGYYLGRKLGEWSPTPGSAATERKIYIGKSSRYYPKIQVSEFLIETGSLKEGDTVMVIGPKTGFIKAELKEMKVNGAKGTMAERGDKVTFPFGIKVCSSDKLYKVVEAVNV